MPPTDDGDCAGRDTKEAVMRFSTRDVRGVWIFLSLAAVVASCSSDPQRDELHLGSVATPDDVSCGQLYVAIGGDDSGPLTFDDGGPPDAGGVCPLEASSDDSGAVGAEAPDLESGTDPLDAGLESGTESTASVASALTTSADAAACWTWDTGTGRGVGGMGGAFACQCSMRLAGPRGAATVAHSPNYRVLYASICGSHCNPDRTSECYPSRRAICEKCWRLAGGLGDTDSRATDSTEGYAWCQALAEPSTCYWSLANGDDPVTFDNMDSWCYIRDPATR
jgi:hypothetical protein